MWPSGMLQSRYNMHFHSSLGLVEKENKNLSLFYVLVLVHWWFPWDSHLEPLIRDSGLYRSQQRCVTVSVCEDLKTQYLMKYSGDFNEDWNKCRSTICLSVCNSYIFLHYVVNGFFLKVCRLFFFRSYFRCLTNSL